MDIMMMIWTQINFHNKAYIVEDRINSKSMKSTTWVLRIPTKENLKHSAKAQQHQRRLSYKSVKNLENRQWYHHTHVRIQQRRYNQHPHNHHRQTQDQDQSNRMLFSSLCLRSTNSLKSYAARSLGIFTPNSISSVIRTCSVPGQTTCSKTFFFRAKSSTSQASSACTSNSIQQIPFSSFSKASSK